jgi:uncharacterized DUF497 family protein
MATVEFGDFEWDEVKAAKNLEKHGVSFEEGASVFSDLDYVLASDPGNPDHYLALGYSSLARMLVVVHCERTDKVRLISARRATNLEARAYEARG